MASPIEITQHLIEPLEEWLGGLKHPNPPVYFKIYFRVLESFTAYQLKRAMEDLEASWKYRGWPAPADIADRCKKFPYEEPKPVKATFKKRDTDPFSDEHVYSRLHGPMAVEAAQNGWASGLFGWLKEHGDLPFPEDEQRIKAGASRLWQQQENVLKGDWVSADGEVKPLKGPVKTLQELAQAMRDREAKIAATILNTNTHKEAG